MTADFSGLAQAYADNRIGYSNELYETIAAYGVKPGASVIDVGCGTGIASAAFANNGFPVTGVDSSAAMLAKARAALPQAAWEVSPAERLPFPAERFDLAISAQAFHWFDRAAALEEILRVLKSRGIVAIWWKTLMREDPMRQLRDEVVRELGSDPPASGLPGGFREFYAARFAEHALRVLPWRTTMTVDRFIGYERSRCNLRRSLGAQADEYFARLETRLRERYPGSDSVIPLAYLQYLYLGKKP
ncbi:MAG TPA: methyltransferase domain-containing protein [Candidatus Baltobacteraceae bacterium]|jgi:ubiquinone/menaquinone biosynthesis C-methylase UbiE